MASDVGENTQCWLAGIVRFLNDIPTKANMLAVRCYFSQYIIDLSSAITLFRKEMVDIRSMSIANCY